ncbi:MULTISPECIES: aminopeptidase [unclassified Bacillus (in: firmicutes)]|uniref:aminopeptidase n=1 Tax=unclassified Bacillus (in: firmicutes) TaxID=185979 RepID=UPI0008E97018|nr:MULTISPECIES: aminopeptidase [unclassified Bacillus (in: firmicutes)]SFB26176.1 Leucyl aminopeptidase (aminopeptidase T) [Bacillus sp. UNCCL13]SFQ91914.1 Leucyl aminopeptidase (aminopeptidase T) [Bacillus sp. cl95]
MDLIEKYARLIVKTGVNLQKNQLLVISSPIETAAFAKMVAEVAYKEGAGNVVVKWEDDELAKIRYLYAPDQALVNYPEWEQDFYLKTVKADAAYINIYAADPEMFKGVDPERIAKAQKAASIAIKEYRERRMSNKNRWAVVSVPTESWAKKVFPELSSEAAIEKMWEVILKTVRADLENPLEAWEGHKRNLKERIHFMHSNRIVSLHFTNSLGTDLKIDLPNEHQWLGGSEHSPDGVEFIANMPTEEIFTVPKKTAVNGKVVASKPLHYNGNLIEDFYLTFKDGKVVEYDAKNGLETLKKLIETDEGSAYLGEVALVPFDSPISSMNILFYNTLYDENASCHLALGKAYPVNIKNSDNYSKEELTELGVNDSLVHADFMFGTRDLVIMGTTDEGQEVKVFENGNFVFEK